MCSVTSYFWGSNPQAYLYKKKGIILLHFEAHNNHYYLCFTMINTCYDISTYFGLCGGYYKYNAYIYIYIHIMIINLSHDSLNIALVLSHNETCI